MRTALVAFALAATSTTATVEMKPLGSNTASGTLTFKQVEGGVEVTGKFTGLAPNSTHGFHVHEKGDCSAKDGSSAGAHWNPTGHQHGAPHDAASHMGDLGNVKSDANGVAVVSVKKAGAQLTGPQGFIGRGVILHEAEDDLKSQPTGNAGGRIACGVIKAK